METGAHDFEHIRSVNECEAIAIASGYHLATGKVGVVYLQNSGLGKTVNPLTSLAHQKVYSIPILLMIGWRGEPGRSDAAQHEKMGPMTLELLEQLDIPYDFLSDNEDDNREILAKAAGVLSERQSPYAIIVKKDIFEPPKIPDLAPPGTNEITREHAIRTILGSVTDSDIIVTTTGKISRELFELRAMVGQAHDNDFNNIGAMCCAQSIAFGIALEKPNNRVIVLDGDAALLMQLGALATVGYYSPKNIYHIVLDNSAHDSTGGQMTFSNNLDLKKIAEGCGYKNYFEATGPEALDDQLPQFLASVGPVLFRLRVKKGARTDLGRPEQKPTFYKSLFMKKMKNI